MAPHFQYSCLENPMDGGAWWAAVHGVSKSRTRLSDFTFIFHFHALEKEMATHSSVLVWRIPGTRGAWWAAVYGVAQSQTRLKRLSSSSSTSTYQFWGDTIQPIMQSNLKFSQKARMTVPSRETDYIWYFWSCENHKICPLCALYCYLPAQLILSSGTKLF